MCSEHYTVCVFNSVTEHEEDSYFSIPKDGMDGDKGVLVLLKTIKLTQISRNTRQASSLQNWGFSQSVTLQDRGGHGGVQRPAWKGLITSPLHTPNPKNPEVTG